MNKMRMVEHENPVNGKSWTVEKQVKTLFGKLVWIPMRDSEGFVEWHFSRKEADKYFDYYIHGESEKVVREELI
jgi:hypothetical protein